MVISSLPPEYQQFVQSEVASGRFGSPTEVVCEALRYFQDYQHRLTDLRQEIQLGVDQLKRGEYIEIRDEAELDAFFDNIEARGRERLAQRKAP